MRSCLWHRPVYCPRQVARNLEKYWLQWKQQVASTGHRPSHSGRFFCGAGHDAWRDLWCGFWEFWNEFWAFLYCLYGAYGRTILRKSTVVESHSGSLDYIERLLLTEHRDFHHPITILNDFCLQAFYFTPYYNHTFFRWRKARQRRSIGTLLQRIDLIPFMPKIGQYLKDIRFVRPRYRIFCSQRCFTDLGMHFACLVWQAYVTLTMRVGSVTRQKDSLYPQSFRSAQ